MSHKTLIDGTSYEITGGRTLIDGTGYDVTGGRTLVDGTGYDVSFGVTWAVYSVIESYVYDGYSTDKSFTPGSNIYWSSSHATKSIKSTATAPTAYTGTYSSKKTPPWKNTFTELGVCRNDLPYQFTQTGYYMFYTGSSATTSRIYYVPKAVTVSVKNAAYVELDATVTAYEAKMTTTYSQGSTQYDNVTAPEGTYPDNGEQDGKWYVRLT